jgi:hypothetical protein
MILVRGRGIRTLKLRSNYSRVPKQLSGSVRFRDEIETHNGMKVAVPTNSSLASVCLLLHLSMPPDRDCGMRPDLHIKSASRQRNGQQERRYFCCSAGCFLRRFCRSSLSFPQRQSSGRIAGSWPLAVWSCEASKICRVYGLIGESFRTGCESRS